MTVNIWGTPIDPKTGLPVYPVNGGTQATAAKLRKQAQDAADAADHLQRMLDDAANAFEKSFAEADRLSATRQRIASVAKTSTI